MPKRQFHDATGTSWDVWDVRPSDASRSAYDRGAGRESSAPETPALSLDPVLENGWLCFQAGTERRRFAPIPPNWWELPDGVLRVMLEIANPVPATPVYRRDATEAT
ncbi:MAG TPA: hypothetical protein VH439_13665 [Gemmatimonadales bacterium]|jgi:hypothetical protein